MILEGKYIWVTSSHLGQQHMATLLYNGKLVVCLHVASFICRYACGCQLFGQGWWILMGCDFTLKIVLLFSVFFFFWVSLLIFFWLFPFWFLFCTPFFSSFPWSFPWLLKLTLITMPFSPVLRDRGSLKDVSCPHTHANPP